MFKVGDNICYRVPESDDPEIFKGMVLEVKEKIRISYHNSATQHVIWVDAADLEKHDTSRCAHNAECGWCDDTGTCIYDSK